MPPTGTAPLGLQRFPGGRDEAPHWAPRSPHDRDEGRRDGARERLLPEMRGASVLPRRESGESLNTRRADCRERRPAGCPRDCVSPPVPWLLSPTPLPGAHWGLPHTEGRPHLRGPRRAAPAAACTRPGYNGKGHRHTPRLPTQPRVGSGTGLPRDLRQLLLFPCRILGRAI